MISVAPYVGNEELLREICASIRPVMQCDGVGVTLSDPETDRLRLYAFDHPGGNGIVHEGDIISAEGSETLVKAFRTSQPVGVAEVESTADPLASAEGLKSLYHLPLVSRERVLCVLSLVSSAENAFPEGDAAFLAQVANQIALAVENAIAYGEIASLKDKLAQEVPLPRTLEAPRLFGNLRLLPRSPRGRRLAESTPSSRTPLLICLQRRFRTPASPTIPRRVRSRAPSNNV